MTQSNKKKLSTKNKKNKNTLPRASQDTRQRLLCRGPFELAPGKEPSFAESQTEGSRQRGRRQPAFGGQGLCREPAFAEWAALGNEPLCRKPTFSSRQRALYRARDLTLGKGSSLPRVYSTVLGKDAGSRQSRIFL